MMSPTDRDDKHEKRRTATLKQWVETQASVLTWDQDATVLIASLPCNPSPGQNLPKYSLSLRYLYLWQYAGYMLGSKSIAD